MHEQYLSHFTMIIMCMTCHHKCRSIYKEEVTETIIRLRQSMCMYHKEKNKPHPTLFTLLYDRQHKVYIWLIKKTAENLPVMYTQGSYTIIIIIVMTSYCI